MKHLTTVALLLLAATPASAGFFDLFKSAETLAAEDHAYCVSIGTKGPTYTQCRMFMTQQRATYRNNAAAALADGLNSASNSFKNNPTRCTTTGAYAYRTTTCY